MKQLMLTLAKKHLNIFMANNHMTWPTFRAWLYTHTGGDIISDDVDIGNQIKLDLDSEKHNPNMMCNISRLKSDLKMLTKLSGRANDFIYNHFTNFAVPITPYRVAKIMHYYKTGQEFSILNRIDVLDIVLYHKYIN